MAKLVITCEVDETKLKWQTSDGRTLTADQTSRPITDLYNDFYANGFAFEAFEVAIQDDNFYVVSARFE